MGTRAVMVAFDDVSPEGGVVLYRFSDGYPEFVLEEIRKLIEENSPPVSVEELVGHFESDGWNVCSFRGVEDWYVDYFYTLVVLRDRVCVASFGVGVVDPVSCFRF